MWKPRKNTGSAGRFLAVGGVVTTFAILIGGAGLAWAAAKPSAVFSAKALTRDTTPTWTWTAGGGGNGTYRYKLDNAQLTTGAIITTLLKFTPDDPLAEGQHTLYVQERDKVGNWSDNGSRAIQIEGPPPPVVRTLPDTGLTKVLQQLGRDSLPGTGSGLSRPGR